MFRHTKRYAALAAVIAVIAGCTGTAFSGPAAVSFSAEAAETGSRIRVDINKNDGRKASYAKNANNWLLEEGSSPSYNVNGVTFKLSNGGSAGGNVTGANNKKLQLQSLDYPYLTMDGAKIKDGDNGGVLKLEISGISEEIGRS